MKKDAEAEVEKWKHNDKNSENNENKNLGN